MVAKPRLSDEAQFVELIKSHGVHEAARRLKLTVGAVYERRARIERRTGETIAGPRHHSSPRVAVSHPGRLDAKLHDGVILVGSDAHYWPGMVTPAHRAFVKFCKDLKPKIIVMNGDILDGASISRHPPIGWENRPSIVNEIEACKDRLGEITLAGGKALRFWPLGNHDARFSTKLATVAPEYAKVHGVSLNDHFPDWQSCWMLVINDDVVIKHRHKGGIHATHNSTLWAGKTTVCGHLHSLKVTPFTDYNGTRFGVDTGTLAEPYSEQFANYTELSPVNWRSGFAVLTFRDGRLLWPEVCHVIDDEHVEFRGEVIRV